MALPTPLSMPVVTRGATRREIIYLLRVVELVTESVPTGSVRGLI